MNFQVTPQADLFEVADTTLKFRLGERYLLRPGTHRIVAELEGYYPIEETIEVGALSDQTFDLEFVRLPGLVTFRTEPEVAAEVSINGEVVGTTPLVDFEVRPGSHQIQFVAERYLSEVTTLAVEGGHERDALTVALTPSWAPMVRTSASLPLNMKHEVRAATLISGTCDSRCSSSSASPSPTVCRRTRSTRTRTRSPTPSTSPASRRPS